MTEYSVIIQSKARADIIGIHDHIASDSPAAAAKLVDDLMHAFEVLRTTSHRNIVYPQTAGSRPPVRSVPVVPYMVFFRAFDDEKVIRILRIRHGARRPLRRFD